MAITETITISPDADRLVAFAALIEKHAAAFRADLEAWKRGAVPGPVPPEPDTDGMPPRSRDWAAGEPCG